MDKVWQSILDLEALLRSNGEFERNRESQELDWFDEFTTHLILERIHQRSDMAVRRKELREMILEKKFSPTAAARALISVLFDEL